MSLPIALILDKSEAFVSFQKDQVLENWGALPQDLQKIGRVTDAGGMTLFGGATVSTLTLDDIESVKLCLADLEEAKADGSLGQRVSKGLFITSPVNRNSTKKLEAFISGLDGYVACSAPDKSEKLTTAGKLLSTLNLNRDAKDFLLTYVGDDYEAIIPLVKTIGKLTAPQQAAVSAEDLYLRMPQAPGATPPWTLEQPLMKGDISTAIDIFRRVSQHSHFLVVLAVLRNKFTVAYKISAILDHDKRTTDEILVSATGANARSLWAIKKLQQQHGTAKLQLALQEIAKTEAKVKGGSAAPPLAAMELMLVRLSEILKAR